MRIISHKEHKELKEKFIFGDGRGDGFRGRDGVADYVERLCPVGAVNFVVCAGIRIGPRLGQGGKKAVAVCQNSLEPFHLFRYLDEEVFRFNRRKATDGERFAEAVQSISGKRLTYQKLTGECLS